MKLNDVDMVCNFSYVNTPLISAMRGFHGEPELMETVMLSAGGVCSDAQVVSDELRCLRASRDKAPDKRKMPASLKALAGPDCPAPVHRLPAHANALGDQVLVQVRFGHLP